VKVLLVFLGVLSIGLPSRGASGEQLNGKNVLVLFGSNRPDNRRLLDFIEADLRSRVPSPIIFYDAYLTTNWDQERYQLYQDSQAETFRLTYGGLDLNLVIAVYPEAVSFVTRYRDKMFPGVPIMFTGVDLKTGWEWKGWPGVPGVTFAVGLRETIDLALGLHPDTKRVAIVAGPDWPWIREIHSELLRRNVEAIDIVSQDPSREMVEKVAALRPHTVALLQTTIVPSRSAFGSRELIREISQTVPTYSAWEYICLDFGCIGGVYTDEQKSAAATTDIAARILSGERPDNIPVVHNTDLRATVDWRALQRWHVPDSALPPGSLVLNHEPTLWERGRKYFLSAIAIIAVQTLLILGLFWQRVRRRKAEAMLRRSEEKFSKSFLQSPLVVTISRTSDSRFIDVNESFEEQLGWTRDEVIGRTPEDFDLWVDADQRGTFLKLLRSNGSVRNLEVCLRKKDGETRTALVSGELIEVGGEPCTVSVAADITERKRAEEVLSTVSRKLIEAHEEERTRIARELHDDINQRLAFLALNISNLREGVPASDATTKEGVEQVRQEVNDLGKDVQALSHRLHSSKLEYLGLTVAATSFCKEFSHQHNVEVDSHIDNIPKELSREISLCLYRVLQESLQNAVKYSGTRRFEARLECTANEIHLSVRDSGVGFDLQSAMNRHGLGLISMTERLKLVDGRLSIESKPQCGTTIHARVPLNAKVKSAVA
jgi:PAS domain S-box-containing protein